MKTLNCSSEKIVLRAPLTDARDNDFMCDLPGRNAILRTMNQQTHSPVHRAS